MRIRPQEKGKHHKRQLSQADNGQITTQQNERSTLLRTIFRGTNIYVSPGAISCSIEWYTASITVA